MYLKVGDLMDPITHAVVGISLAVLAGEPLALSNPVLIGSIIGAVIPDSDIVMQLKGHGSYLKNHRGISHSLFAFPIYAALVTFALSFIYQDINLLRVFLFSFFGSLSHAALDLANTYGARVLWPIFKKRLTFNLLLVYDPVVLISGLLIILPITRQVISPFLVISLFSLYFFIRIMMKLTVIKILGKNFEEEYKIDYIKVLPSMIGFLKWHFVVGAGEKKIIGELNLFNRGVKVIGVMDNIDNELFNIAINTPTARFFKDFTPLFHVHCEKKEEGYIFDFVDLRYYMAKDFVHNATTELNNNFEVVTSLFHPYKKTTNVEI